MTLVEQVARAAFAQSQALGNWQGFTFDDDDMANVREAYFSLARAIIPVVREECEAQYHRGYYDGRAALGDTQ